MDRRNGGDPLAPPRPPKLLPRVHRPRAPEPTIMSDTNQHQHHNNSNNNNQNNNINNTSTPLTNATAAAAATSTTIQCTNNSTTAAATITPNTNNHSISINNNNINNSNGILNSTTTAAATISATNPLLTIGLVCNNSNNNNSNSNTSSTSNNNHCSGASSASSGGGGGGGNVVVIPTTQIDLVDDYQIHHLTFLPQRPSSLSRTGSHVSSNSTTSSTASSSITAANSFTRRRPPPPRPPGAAVPLLTIGVGSGSNSSSSSNAGNNNNNINNNNSSSSSINSNFFSHFQSVADASSLQPAQALPAAPPVSPVTLAQPRPESERLANEYVDTPLRNAQQQQQQLQQQQQQQLQLQHTSRVQHPAGQHDFGQTTTHHLLLLPQRELRQQQQQLQQQHSSRAAGTAGTANATLAHGTDGTDGFLHSHPQHHHNHNHQHHHQHQQHLHHLNHLNHLNSHHHLLHGKPASAAMATSASANATSPHTGKLIATTATSATSPGLLGSFATPAQSSPITKQPTNTTTIHHQQQHQHQHNVGKFSKDLPALDNLLDLHSITSGINTPQGVVSSVDGANALGMAMVDGGGGNSLTSITCPHCGGCRCQECQRPRPLPQTWVCNKTCLCSAESVIDYASCLCCAKALFYHCARDNDMDGDDGSGTPCVDNPCSCGPYKRTQRWGWLGALSLLLPCLWFYWPMRGCVAICEKCYGRYAVRGCRCQHIGSTSSMQPIVHMGANGGGLIGIGSVGGGGQNGSVGGGVSSNTKSLSHSDCSTASRILRKGDLTPEKRLLDSSPEY